MEGESKIYSDGLLRYQNFYLEGSFGEFDLWGKIYFHAQEVRYQKFWLNAEIPLGEGTFRSSFNHWASAADYSSGDKTMFGSWPCARVGMGSGLVFRHVFLTVSPTTKVCLGSTFATLHSKLPPFAGASPRRAQPCGAKLITQTVRRGCGSSR